MRRRTFIEGIAAQAAAWPLAARAQQSPSSVIGFLSSGSWDGDDVRRLPPFRQGLGEAGYIEGQNIAIEYPGADNQLDRLPALAAELVHRQVSPICLSSSSHFPLMLYSKIIKPVTLPPGRARSLTKPRAARRPLHQRLL